MSEGGQFQEIFTVTYLVTIREYLPGVVTKEVVVVGIAKVDVSDEEKNVVVEDVVSENIVDITVVVDEIVPEVEFKVLFEDEGIVIVVV